MAEHQRRLQELSDSLESLQQQLAAASADYRRELEQQKRTPADIQRALPPNTALVDYLEFTHFDSAKIKGKEATIEQHLAAFVVRPPASTSSASAKEKSAAPSGDEATSISWLDLGPAQPISDLVDHWRQTYSAADDEKLRRLVWQPLEDKLAGASTVLVSPDGALDRFPLAALPGKREGTYLIEDVAIATVPIPRLLPELLAFSQPSSGNGGPAENSAEPSLLTVGEVDFKAPLVAKAAPDQLAMAAPVNRGSAPGSLSRSMALAARYWPLTIRLSSAFPMENTNRCEKTRPQSRQCAIRCRTTLICIWQRTAFSRRRN